MPLADGNTAYVGDTVVTRHNDRRLRLGPNDWVKNGDRWTVHHVQRDGSLTVRHQRTGRPVTLPADYVAAAVELGYASTVHGAQGITADTVHGVATGDETRQQLYTMLTRGSNANHLYLQVVGDGDPHNLLQPQNVRPPTATEILERILVRDDAPVSATTTARDHASPTARLGAATERYLDALHVAAEHHLGTTAIAHLEAGADRIVPSIADDPAWPTLRAHLILLAATGAEPLTALHFAAGSRELDTADDRAAVLDWRLDDHLTPGNGPLPWLPGIPSQVRHDPRWGPYLTARSELVADLATDVRHQATSTQETPPWWTPGRPLPTPDLLGDLAVWRAANAIPDSDHRPTGPTQPVKANTAVAARPRHPAGKQQHRHPGRLDRPRAPLGARHPPRRLHTPARTAPRRTLGRWRRCPHPAPHHHRRSATGRARRLRPLVAHPTPPARPPRPR